MTDRFHIHVHGPDRGPLPISFEQAEARLGQHGGIAFEPDGSLVWSGDGGRHQIFGMLYDAMGQLQYIELRGNATASELLELVGWIFGSAGRRAIEGFEVILLPSGGLQSFQDFAKSLQEER